MNKRTSLLALAAIMTAFAGKAALAADLAPPPPPPPAPEIRASVSDWTGPYLGAVLGGTCMDTEWDFQQDTDRDGTIDVVTPDLPMNGCGLSGGVLAGFNYQIDNVVLGVEGDWTWGSKTGKHTDIITGGVERDHYKIKWQNSLRARVGLLATQNTLFYVTGGVSWLRGRVKETTPVEISDTRTHLGYVLGGGIEHALTENIHLRAEYLYSSFKKKTYGPFTDPGPYPTASAKIGLDDVHTFRAGVTWNFPVSTW